MVLEVTYGQVTSGGTERDVRVYAGNPEVFVDIKDAAGTLQDDAVSVSMYW